MYPVPCGRVLHAIFVAVAEIVQQAIPGAFFVVFNNLRLLVSQNGHAVEAGGKFTKNAFCSVERLANRCRKVASVSVSRIGGPFGGWPGVVPASFWTRWASLGAPNGLLGAPNRFCAFYLNKKRRQEPCKDPKT